MQTLTTLPEDCLVQIVAQCHQTKDTQTQTNILVLRLSCRSAATALKQISAQTIATLLSEDFRPGLFQLPRDGVVDCMRYIQQQHCRLAFSTSGVYKGIACAESQAMAKVRNHIADFDKNFYSECLEKYDSEGQALRASVVMRVTFHHVVVMQVQGVALQLQEMKNNQGRVLVWEVKSERKSNTTKGKRRRDAVDSVTTAAEFQECWMVPHTANGTGA